jgi:hypothetical protein
MEDLTVNTQQAEFAAQQNAQSQANIMSGMNQAAGGSGVAGMAQALANQGQLATQKASASIGLQEAANQKLAAQGEAKLQQLQGQGKYMSQGMERSKVSSLLGMAQGRRQEADAARQAARDQMAAGVGTMMGGVGGAVGKGMTGGTGSFFGNMKKPGDQFGANEFSW